MESVSKARARLGRYPALLASCGPQAAAYGKCVGNYMGEVQRDQCKTEFDAFIKCIRASATKMGTRL